VALDALLIGWPCFGRVVGGGGGGGVGGELIGNTVTDGQSFEKRREEKRKEKAEADFWSSRRLVVREGLLL